MTAARLVRAVVLVVAAVVLSPAPAQESATTVARPAIPYKSEPTPIDEYGPRLTVVLLGLLAAAATALYVLRRRLPQLRDLGTPTRRLKVIERVRLNPRCTLFVVQLDRRELLIGQCGDRLVQLDPPQTDPRETP